MQHAEFGSPLPVAGLVMPMGAALLPAIGNPVVAVPFANVVAGDPDVLVAAPLPKSRRPYVTDARFGNRLDAHRRRRDIDVDADSGRCNGRCGHRPRGHHQAQQQCPMRSFHSTSLVLTSDPQSIQTLATNRAHGRLTAGGLSVGLRRIPRTKSML